MTPSTPDEVAAALRRAADARQTIAMPASNNNPGANHSSIVLDLSGGRYSTKSP